MSYLSKDERSTLKNIIEKKQPNTENDSEELINCCTFKFKEMTPKMGKKGEEVINKKHEQIKDSKNINELNDLGGKFSDIINAIKTNHIEIVSIIDDDNTVMNGIIGDAKERYVNTLKEKENTKSRDAAIKAIHKAESFYAMEAAKDAMKLWIRLEQTYLDSKKSKKKILKSIPNHAKKILKDMHTKQKEEEKEAKKAEKEAKKAEKEANSESEENAESEENLMDVSKSNVDEVIDEEDEDEEENSVKFSAEAVKNMK